MNALSEAKRQARPTPRAAQARPLPLSARIWSLLGRRAALTQVLRHAWQSLVEVGPESGRDLLYLAQFRPSADFGVVCEAPSEVVQTQARCPWARTQRGPADTSDYIGLLDKRPDRVLFTYSLGTQANPTAALRRAQQSLALGGEVIVIDFWNLNGCPSWLQGSLRTLRQACGVRPISRALLAHFDAVIEAGPWGLWAVARIKRAR